MAFRIENGQLVQDVVKVEREVKILGRSKSTRSLGELPPWSAEVLASPEAYLESKQVAYAFRSPGVGSAKGETQWWNLTLFGKALPGAVVGRNGQEVLDFADRRFKGATRSAVATGLLGFLMKHGEGVLERYTTEYPSPDSSPDDDDGSAEDSAEV